MVQGMTQSYPLDLPPTVSIGARFDIARTSSDNNANESYFKADQYWVFLNHRCSEVAPSSTERRSFREDAYTGVNFVKG